MSSLDQTAPLTDTNAVIEAGASACGSPITVKDEAMPRGRYGMCTKAVTGEHVIIVDTDLSGDLRLHTVLHELGHILLGHNNVPTHSAPDRLTALLTGAPALPAPAACVAPEYRQLAQRENEAEQFASTVARRLRRGLTSGHLSRLDEAFG